MPTINTSLHVVSDADGAAILDVERGQISTLNATGAFIWRGLQQGEDASFIATALARETGQDRSLVERDVQDFLNDLKKRDLMPR